MIINTFRNRIRQSIKDEDLQIALDGNARRRTNGRVEAFSSLPDFAERRKRAHAIREDVIAHLDEYLNLFMDKATSNGMLVHRAVTGEEAIQICLRIAEEHHASLVAKSKSMLSEEINFNHKLAAAGIRVVETDLGEYIVQLRGERPSHILTPAVHLRREQVGQLFHEKLGVPYTEDIPEMVTTARNTLREVFLSAKIGVSGVNFGVTETGTICLVTNEGNGRMVTSLPPVHVALMGIERLIPTLEDLALFLSLLPRSGTGQKLSAYTSLIHSPKRSLDMDGPQERHLILVDNCRSSLRASPLSEALFCIRCGACLNACPVFREIGGHAYVGRDGAIAAYPGPIGSVISPGLLGCENFGQLAQASSLCGACKEVCPVDIALPDLLLRVRAGEIRECLGGNAIKEGVALPGMVKLGINAFRLAACNPRLFALGQWLGGLISRAYSPKKQYLHLPTWTGWGYSKDFPRLALRPFRSQWKKIHQEIVHRDRGSGRPQEAVTPTYNDSRSLATRFSDELTDLGGHVYLLSEKEVQIKLADFLQQRGIDRVCGDTFAKKYVPPNMFINNPDPTIRIGITGAFAGLADTGSLVLVGGNGHPLTASLLPDIHLAILQVSDLLPTLSEALKRPEIQTASMTVIVTGPSRTADIEMSLTIGVHGPKELHVFLVQ